MLLEHLEGKLPTWLSPVQVNILPIGEAHQTFAQEVAKELKTAGLRVETNMDNESLGKKIQHTKHMKVPYWLVIGDKEVAANSVQVESRDEGSVGTVSLAQFITDLKEKNGQHR